MRCGEVTGEGIAIILRNNPVGAVTKLLAVGEASQILSVHPNTLRKWSDRGMIPTYRIGNRGDRRFVMSDLLDFLERARSGGV